LAQAEEKVTRFLSSLAVAAFASVSALAAHDQVYKDTPDSMRGFLAATDPLYVKECGSCHFPYSPGLLPARSWVLHLDRLDKHFGESIKLAPQERAALQRYLTSNAADVSPFEGSQLFMERIDPASTPYRFRDVYLFREMHGIIINVIEVKPQVKVRSLTNCNGCHLGAERGSFGTAELFVPGLTRNRRDGRKLLY
jgi:hypothetical protein